MATQDTVSPQSVGSGTAEYDPRTDPKRKARSGDPGWKYGFWPEIGNRDLVECILCGTQVKVWNQEIEGASCRWIWRCSQM